MKPVLLSPLALAAVLCTGAAAADSVDLRAVTLTPHQMDTVSAGGAGFYSMAHASGSGMSQASSTSRSKSTNGGVSGSATAYACCGPTAHTHVARVGQDVFPVAFHFHRLRGIWLDRLPFKPSWLR